MIRDETVLWAPLSELYGRRLPIVSAAFGFAIFNIAVAVAKDIQTVMICRFFGGLLVFLRLVLIGFDYFIAMIVTLNSATDR